MQHAVAQSLPRWCNVLTFALLVGRSLAAADPVDAHFTSKVKPILDGKCVSCHGPKVQKGGLRLDSLAGLLKGGETGAAAVAGKPDESALIRSVRRIGDLPMPPKQALSAQEVADLTTWVVKGLRWPGSPAAPATAPVEPVAPAKPPVSEKDRAGIEFFEKEIRPLFHTHCIECHGSNEPKADLQFTSREAVLEGGKSGPAAVAGKPQDSLFIKAINHQGGLKMPKGGAKLDAAAIAALTKWVEMDMPWPDASAGVAIVESASTPYVISAEQRAWWSFQPVKPPAAPAVKDAAWVKSDIDRFILADLEAKGLQPAPPAEKLTLLRRATYDLTGLPPTPEEIAAFTVDTSADSYAKVIDRLLASPRYGERWARHWLDGVRYADSLNLEDYQAIGNISYPYRDWVIRSLNRDLPYDRFITYQIAGDLAPAKDNLEKIDNRLGTALLAMGAWMEQDSEQAKARAEIVDQQIDVVSRNVLGLTISCARCHNHKFDPISTADYYALAGIFFSTKVTDKGLQRKAFLMAPEAQLKAYESAKKAASDLNGKVKSLIRAKKTKDQPDSAELAAARKDEAKAKAALAAIPAPYKALGAEDGSTSGRAHKIADSRIYIRGNYKQQGELVPRRFPQVLAGESQTPIPPTTSGRLELAAWMTRPDHPLTARVMANRIWQHHFTQGLVRTPDNFGRMGERPSHPGLLDYLAKRFTTNGWSIKSMHREIMLSATYQQASIGRPETIKADPDNHLFGRMNRRRLEAEAVRDGLLMVSGGLDLARVSGPPEENGGMRTIFQKISRRSFHRIMFLFDGPDPSTITMRREVSTVAPQTLFAMNGSISLQAGNGLAKRAFEMGSDQAARIDKAYILAFGRRPSDAEMAQARSYLGSAGSTPIDAKTLRNGGTPWHAFCHALVCTNEFIFVD